MPHDNMSSEAHPGWVNFFAKRSSSPTAFTASAINAEVNGDARAAG